MRVRARAGCDERAPLGRAVLEGWCDVDAARAPTQRGPPQPCKKVSSGYPVHTQVQRSKRSHYEIRSGTIGLHKDRYDLNGRDASSRAHDVISCRL